jgi:hypothetical protein
MAATAAVVVAAAAVVAVVAAVGTETETEIPSKMAPLPPRAGILNREQGLLAVVIEIVDTRQKCISQLS